LKFFKFLTFEKFNFLKIQVLAFLCFLCWPLNDMLVYVTQHTCDLHLVHLGMMLTRNAIKNKINENLLNSRLTVILIPIVTFIIYLPSLFRYEVVKCVLSTDGSITYYKRNNDEFLNSMFYSVSRVESPALNRT
jgi:hypothetical protein